jgi:non-canonical purine NTP pyrophosphatase (RdgB/HAM1 family)
VSFVDSGKEIIAVMGECAGEIVADPRGTNGFGYDPVFLVPELNRTFAEMTGEDKHGLSHRGRALADFSRRFRMIYF